MPSLVQIGSQPKASCGDAPKPFKRSMTVFWLQGITLIWMSVECAVALFAAASAPSPAMLAFGSDSLVESAFSNSRVAAIPAPLRDFRKACYACRQRAVIYSCGCCHVYGGPHSRIARSARSERARHWYHRRRSDCDACPRVAEAPRSTPNQQSSAGRGCRPISDVCIPGRRDTGRHVNTCT
jgi:hypothetical protein